MPRNVDAMELCDFTEKLLREKSKPPFDKKAYQREYMRRVRAEAKK